MSTSAKLIIQKWKANLPFKARTKDMVQSNFDELFCDLSSAQIPFEEAHDLINEAATAHYPSYPVAQAVYKKYNHTMPFAEFYKDWKKTILDKAMKSFFDFYNLQDNVEQKSYGMMSKEEYSKQRAYANSFQAIDFSTFKDFELEDELPEDLF